MFGKLKEKLKSWVGKVSEVKEEKNEKKYIEAEKVFNDGMQGYVPDPEKTIKKIKEIQEKEFFLKKISLRTKKISPKEFAKYSEELEMILLENNVALEISKKILMELEEKIVGKEIARKEIENILKKSLKDILEEILIPPFDMLKEIKEKKGQYIILFCGINGSGKTTTIAKFSNLLKKEKISSVFAAADTFRAASIEQLEVHGKKLGIKVISHEYGSDPASVGFDAIKHAEKEKIKVVLIDTAGRIHTAKDLLREMVKIKRVCKPDRTIFIGESITGNDAVNQVKAFDETIGIDGIILSKADIDEKGGTALSLGYITKKPLLYLGTGQTYKDLEPFNKKKFIENLGL